MMLSARDDDFRPRERIGHPVAGIGDFERIADENPVPVMDACDVGGEQRVVDVELARQGVARDMSRDGVCGRRRQYARRFASRSVHDDPLSNVAVKLPQAIRRAISGGQDRGRT
jgi:hypothetical protein